MQEMLVIGARLAKAMEHIQFWDNNRTQDNNEDHNLFDKKKCD